MTGRKLVIANSLICRSCEICFRLRNEFEFCTFADQQKACKRQNTSDAKVAQKCDHKLIFSRIESAIKLALISFFCKRKTTAKKPHKAQKEATFQTVSAKFVKANANISTFELLFLGRRAKQQKSRAFQLLLAFCLSVKTSV